MKNRYFLMICILMILSASQIAIGQQRKNNLRQTMVTIVDEKFYINGTPTYEGVTWETSYGGSYSLEGLLMNARLVQGVFDDLNTNTRGQWAYPDTGEWDPDRNTDEFVMAMASWKENGLSGFTLNLQGGCPYGYCSSFPWDNSTFAPDGSLRDPFMQRTERIIDRADELGLIVILGLFYFGEDGILKDEEAVRHAVRNAATWVLEKGYTNVIIEINNECSIPAYDHEILKCEQVHELIKLVQNIEIEGRTLYASTSLAGGHVPTDNIVAVSDFILLHGNGVQDYRRITEISEEVRNKAVYRPMPMVNNEDDIPWRNQKQGWEETGNNFVASVKSYTGWGYFDFRLPDEDTDYNLGFQSIPVNWQISSERKQNFFQLLAKITGSPGTPLIDLDFSEKIGEQFNVTLKAGPAHIEIEKMEIIVNNNIVATANELPKTFLMDEIDHEIMEGEHWIKARLTYSIEGRQITVESPYYKNPWWPYGGIKKD